METLDMETDPQKIWDNFRQIAKDMGIELPEQDPAWKDRPDFLKIWHITVPRTNEPN